MKKVSPRSQAPALLHITGTGLQRGIGTGLQRGLGTGLQRGLGRARATEGPGQGYRGA